jgi:hypothetical protein
MEELEEILGNADKALYLGQLSKAYGYYTRALELSTTGDSKKELCRVL